MVELLQTFRYDHIDGFVPIDGSVVPVLTRGDFFNVVLVVIFTVVFLVGVIQLSEQLALDLAVSLLSLSYRSISYQNGTDLLSYSYSLKIKPKVIF